MFRPPTIYASAISGSKETGIKSAFNNRCTSYTPSLMLIKFVRRGDSPLSQLKLERRKGGGGKGLGKAPRIGGPRGGGISSGSTKSPGPGQPDDFDWPIPISSSGSSQKSIPFGSGGGPISKIPLGAAFADREVGGGTRKQVYGTSVYGSGYPGETGRGVAGRGFPFYYWPIVFLPPATLIGAEAANVTVKSLPYAYLYRSEEYGTPDNSTRPGGPLQQAGFQAGATSFHIVSDDSTAWLLYSTVQNACGSTTTTFISPAPYTKGDPPSPQPEQAIQYYRASSVVLTLNGYNNTAVFDPSAETTPVPLPSTVDLEFLDCVNSTIGEAVPLIGGSMPMHIPLNGNPLTTISAFVVLYLCVTNVLF